MQKILDWDVSAKPLRHEWALSFARHDEKARPCGRLLPCGPTNKYSRPSPYCLAPRGGNRPVDWGRHVRMLVGAIAFAVIENK
jgi:hypothetical protein